MAPSLKIKTHGSAWLSPFRYSPELGFERAHDWSVASHHGISIGYTTTDPDGTKRDVVLADFKDEDQAIAAAAGFFIIGLEHGGPGHAEDTEDTDDNLSWIAYRLTPLADGSLGFVDTIWLGDRSDTTFKDAVREAGEHAASAGCSAAVVPEFYPDKPHWIA